MSVSVRTLLGGAVLVAVAAAVIGGLLVTGSPKEARAQRLDERRVSDLRRLQGGVSLYWTRAKKMPQSLDATIDLLAWAERPVDPVSAKPYEYRLVPSSETGYELCATFDRASPASAPFPDDPFWSHRAGRQCFPLTATELGK